MSGGTFGYRDRRLEDLADEVIDETYLHDRKDVIAKGRSLARRLLKLQKEIKALDDYLSGDTSTF
jgi:hypothetical protein